LSSLIRSRSGVRGDTARLVAKDWPDAPPHFLKKPYRALSLAEHVRAVLDEAIEADAAD
jgi:hypothetical protein